MMFYVKAAPEVAPPPEWPLPVQESPEYLRHSLAGQAALKPLDVVVGALPQVLPDPLISPSESNRGYFMTHRALRRTVGRMGNWAVNNYCQWRFTGIEQVEVAGLDLLRSAKKADQADFPGWHSMIGTARYAVHESRHGVRDNSKAMSTERRCITALQLRASQLRNKN